MGLDKDTASARISRYESESMAISLESLFELAVALNVPPAYMLASSPAMANAILALGAASDDQQALLADLLNALNTMPTKERKAWVERLLESRKKSP